MKVFRYLIIAITFYIFKFNRKSHTLLQNYYFQILNSAVAQIPIEHKCEPTGKDFSFWGPTSECAERCHHNPKVPHSKPTCTNEKCFCKIPVIIKGFKFHNDTIRNKFLNKPMPGATSDAKKLDHGTFLQITALVVTLFPVIFNSTSYKIGFVSALMKSIYKF